MVLNARRGASLARQSSLYGDRCRRFVLALLFLTLPGCRDAAKERASPPQLPVGFGTATRAYLEGVDRRSREGWAERAAGGETAFVYLHGLALFKDAANEAELESSLNWVRRAAVDGLPEAQFTLGRILLGEGPGKKDQVAGLIWIRAAAESGLAYAQYDLAKVYERGTLVPADLEESLQWLRIAADAGLEAAQGDLLGLALSGDIGMYEVIDYARQLSEQGDSTAYCVLGSTLLDDGDADSRAQALEYLRRAATGGSAHAHLRLAIELAGSEHGSDKLVLEHLQAAAAAGSPQAELLLGQALVDSQDANNRQRGRALLQQLSDNGDADATFSLAQVMTREGDVADAARLLRQAAEVGHMEAAAFLGDMLLTQSSGDRDEALKWLRRSADVVPSAQYSLGMHMLAESAPGGLDLILAAGRQGHQPAEVALGRLFLEGEHVGPNPFEAVRWLRRAVLGHPESDSDAVRMLAHCYGQGVGVPADKQIAADLLLLLPTNHAR